MTVSWAFSDGCSGIRKFNVTVGSLAGGWPLWSELLNASRTTTTLGPEVTGALPDGRYSVAVEATSYAGLVVVRSAILIIDREPPSPMTPEVSVGACLPADAPHADVQWGAFFDAASDVAVYQLAMYTAGADSLPPSTGHEYGSGQPGGASVTLGAVDLFDVGAARQLRLPAWRLRVNATETSLSRSIYFRVRGCDSAGLCSLSNWSDRLLLVSRPPAGGHAQLAAVPSPYTPSPSLAFLNPSTRMAVNFSGFVTAGCPSFCEPPTLECFYDATCTASPRRLGGRGCNAGGAGLNCRACGFGGAEPCPSSEGATEVAVALSYEVCIGTTPLGCQLVPFTPAPGGAWLSSEGLPLQCGASYFAVVRATNCAGLQRSVASTATKLCCEPPLACGSRARCGSEQAGEVQLEDREGNSVAFVGDSHALLFANWDRFTDSCSGVRSLAVLLIVEPSAVIWRVELLKDSVSVQLPIDILDQLAHEVSVEVVVEAVSNAGLSARLTASFAIDRTPPLAAEILVRRVGPFGAERSGGPLCVSSGSASIELDWSRMVDEQSGIANSTVGLFTGGNDGNLSLVRQIHVQDRTFAALDLFGGAGANVSWKAAVVTACNPLGSCTRSPLFELRVVSEPPMGGFVTRPRPVGVVAQEGVVERFMARNVSGMLNVAFGAFTPGAGATYERLSYEVCIGTTPLGCQLVPFTTAANASWASGDLSPLQCGASYYAVVRATNCAGLQRTVTSAAAKLCCEPPTVVGELRLLDSKSGTPVAFVGNVSVSVRAGWTSSFVESCSGVRSLDVSILDTAATLLWQWQLLPHAHSVSLPTEQLGQLEHSESVRVVVEATSGAGLSTRLEATLTVDLTPPSAGVLYTGGVARAHAVCSSSAQPLHLSWEGLEDEQSGVSYCEWAIGTSFHGEQLKSFSRVELSIASTTPRAWQNLTILEANVGKHVFSTLRCVNGAGAASSATSRAVLIVAAQCPSSFTCLAQSGDDLPGRSVKGVHPLFLPLALASTALRYEVRGDVDLPSTGRSRMAMTVSLRHLTRLPDGSRLVRMHVEPDSVMEDKWGASHPMGSELHRPFVFVQLEDGSIPAVYHSPTENENALWTKRLLTSYIQIVHSPTRTRVWTTTERDSGGLVAANYTRRRCLFGREVYYKQMRWHASQRAPEHLTISSTVRASFDRGSSWVRSISSQLRITATSAAHADSQGLEFLPSEPASLTWVRSGRGSRALRSDDYSDDDGDGGDDGDDGGDDDSGGGGGDDRNSDDNGNDDNGKGQGLGGHGDSVFVRGLVGAELEHTAAPEGVAKARHRLGRLPALRPDIADDAAGEVQLSCEGGEARRRLSRLVVCASETEHSQRRGKCATQVGDISAACDELHVAAADEIYTHLLAADCAVPGRCTGLFNALEAAGTVDAQAALARYIDSGGHILGLEFSLALTSFTPTEALFQALLRRLLREDEVVREGLLLATRTKHDWLLEEGSTFLLAVASVAHAAVNSDTAATAREVIAVVNACLARSVHVDAWWDSMHEHAHHTAGKHWARLDPSAKHDWIRHTSHLSRRALQWARRTGHYGPLLERGKRALQRAHARRHPAFDPAAEARSEDRVIAALRAVHNAGARETSHLVHACLSHRSEAVIVAAAGALAAADDDSAEARLLPLLRRTHGVCADDDDSPYVAERVVRALNDAGSIVRNGTISEAVRLLLRHPLAAVHCSEHCKESCNPFESAAHCKERCQRCCRYQMKAANHMRHLLRRAVQQNSHASLGIALRRHLPNEGTHPSHHRWAAHAASRTAREASDAPARRLYGFDDFLADAKGVLGDLEEFRETAQGYLDVYLAKVDLLADALDTVSLTFIDLVLSHQPTYYLLLTTYY